MVTKKKVRAQKRKTPVRKKRIAKKRTSKKPRLSEDGFMPLPTAELQTHVAVAGHDIEIEKVLSGFILQGASIEQTAAILEVDPDALREKYGVMFRNHTMVIRALFVHRIYELALAGHQQALKVVQGVVEEEDEELGDEEIDAFFADLSDTDLRTIIGALAEEDSSAKPSNGKGAGRAGRKKRNGFH